MWFALQTIGFIFPIHWSELSTSLKATLRVSDLSFGSLSEQINCVNLWLVNKPSDLSFRFTKKPSATQANG